ncbi:uncharacterized protein LOC123536415 [Mercenaria mercenaria]|uniref:uncharacterized protein LOC123536415 n=1 Tax=Mercenaria mercenaria TaxID=6596 RepID=UPI00234E6266|nr:uncharacterized protein LOC123536415 [Mercenaria mercenaria]
MHGLGINAISSAKESEMNIVANDVQEKQIEIDQSTPRRRKLAVAHHNNGMIFDANGNTHQIQRLDSVSETVPDVPSHWTEKDENENEERNSALWEHSVLQQIQSLMRNVQVSESLADYINKEILNGTDINANVGHRTRRKSCFSFNNETHSQTSRRQSVANLYQNKSKSLPRTNINNGALNDARKGRRSSVVHSNGRRISNAGQSQGRRGSVVNQHGGRRCSVVHSNVQITSSSSRRNSVAHLSRRRSSLAHAYQHSAMSSLRKMSSVNDNFVEVPINAVPQRRRSSVKPPCFPVTKISSVQKRLHRIYNRRRRRQDRAEVKMSDVRRAFKGLKNENYAETSESDDNATNNNECSSGTEQTVSDEDGDVCKEQTISPIVAKETESELNAVNAKGDIVGECVIDNVDEAKPNPRRKTSIQVRSWELSRKLRQRRREKRKGFTESDLI